MKARSQAGALRVHLEIGLIAKFEKSEKNHAEEHLNQIPEQGFIETMKTVGQGVGA